MRLAKRSTPNSIAQWRRDILFVHCAETAFGISGGHRDCLNSGSEFHQDLPEMVRFFHQ